MSAFGGKRKKRISIQVRADTVVKMGDAVNTQFNSQGVHVFDAIQVSRWLENLGREKRVWPLVVRQRQAQHGYERVQSFACHAYVARLRSSCVVAGAHNSAK